MGLVHCGIYATGLLECRHDVAGRDYRGTTASTVSGRTCQRWDSQSPHQHTFNDLDAFPDSSTDEAANYCRNPDGTPNGPWCYTTDPQERWEQCAIDFCTHGIGETDSPFHQNILQWCHNERYGVSDHRRLDGLFKRLFRRRSKKTSKLRITGLCEGNPPVTSEFPSQTANKADRSFHLMTSSCSTPGAHFTDIV